jgi:parvulin-like peptidyl-prolyl isomerase
MTKKTDDKAKKDDEKDLDKEELENEEDEDEEDEDEEEEDEEEEDEEEEEDAKAAPAKPVDRRRPRHEEYLAGGDTTGADTEDPAWWAPHAVLGVLVLLGVLGFLGVFNKAIGAIAPKLGLSSGVETTTAAAAPTSKPASPTSPTPPTPQQAQPQREMFGAKHILVMYKGSRRAPPGIERTKEEAQARAAEAQKKAKGGTKFEDLVKEYSDEPNAAQRGGDLGKFPKGSMVPEFQDGLEKTKVGEISDVVESPFGFHVILRTQ